MTGAIALALTTALAVCAAPVLALDNGLGRVPTMGYNSWYDVQCALDEATMRTTADALQSTGLADVGYKGLNLDDCWAQGRFPNGTVYTTDKFTGGTLKPLADYVHSKGFTFGTYTCRGNFTCAHRPGALGHESIDAQTYADWGVDLLKEDSCFATADHEGAFAEYGAMRDALNKTGRPILFSLCGWNPWYAPVGASLGNYWRIGPDDTNWNGVLTNININSALAQYAAPGGFNDPCLLLAEDGSGNLRVTQAQSRAQFSMWAVMASPLLISANIRNMSTYNLQTYLNKEVIAVDQDPLGRQGTRLVGGNLSDAGGGGNAVGLASCNPKDPSQQWETDQPTKGFLRNKGATARASDADWLISDAEGDSDSDGADAGAHAGDGRGALGRADTVPRAGPNSMCLNADDCSSDLITFACVTSGGTCCGADCYDNEVFKFSGGALVTPLKGGQCVAVTGDAVALAQCESPVPASQAWSYDPSTMLVHWAGADGTDAAAATAATAAATAAALRGGAASEPLCLTSAPPSAGNSNVWARLLADGGWALVFVNAGGAAADITCDAACFGHLLAAATPQADAKVTFHARDLWAHKNLPDIVGTTSTVSYTAQGVAADGGVVMLKVCGSTEAACVLDVTA